MMAKSGIAVVTGRAGFVGSHLEDLHLGRGIETYVIDNLSTGSRNNLKQHDGNKLLHFDLGDANKIDNLLVDVGDIDAVFHEAAIASVPRSVSEPMVVHEANVNTSLNVMNFCVKANVRKLIFASSAAVYGIIKGGPANEGQPCKPYSPYGATKISVEKYLSAYYHTYGLETTALRYFNVFGPRQILNDYSGVITIFINKLLRRETPVVYGDGSQTRDFVHVKDIVRANLLCMESSSAVGEVFNVATGRPISILDLLLVLKSVTGMKDIAHTFGPPRSGDVKFGEASIDKIRNMIAFDPKIEISEGLAGVVDYIKSDLTMHVMG